MSKKWFRLSSIHVGGELVELLAACCVDGIGVIARWELRADRGWDVTAMDTEGGDMKPVTDFHEGESVPPTPPACVESDLLTPAVIAGARERLGQRVREGYDDAHDAAHVNGELAAAAACYARPPSGRFLQVRAYGPDLGVGREAGGQAIAMVPGTWPWEVESWKPSPDNRKREVEKAVGLLLAEWERLDLLEKLKARADA